MTYTMLVSGATGLFRPGTAREAFLSAAAAFFLKTATWPTVRDVERILEHRGPHIDASREARHLCGSLGRLHEGRIVLTVRGLHQAAPKDPVLRGFKSGLDLALERFREGDWTAEPTLSTAELEGEAQLLPDQARCAMALMAAEGLVSFDDSGTAATITPSVRRFRAVETIPEYIAERSAVDRRRCIGRIAPWRRGSESTLLSRQAFKTVVLGAAGTLLAALVLWLGSVLFPVGGEERSRPPSAPAPERPADEGTAGTQKSPVLYSRSSAAARSGG